MQIFPKTKGFCNKRGLFRKKSLFSIKTTFTFLEKLKSQILGFRKKSDFGKNRDPCHSPDCPESCWEVRLRSGQAILLQVDRRSHQYHPGFQNIQKVVFTNPRIPHDKESSCSPWSQRLADCGGCPQARALIQSCLVEEDHLAPPHRRRFSDRGDFYELQLFWFWWSTTDLLLSLSSYLNIAVTPLPWHTTCVYHSGYHPPNSWR